MTEQVVDAYSDDDGSRRGAGEFSVLDDDDDDDKCAHRQPPQTPCPHLFTQPTLPAASVQRISRTIYDMILICEDLEK